MNQVCVDFNNVAICGCVRLNTNGAVHSLTQFTPTVGETVLLTDDDELEVEGVLEFRKTPGYRTAMWLARYDPQKIRNIAGKSTDAPFITPWAYRNPLYEKASD